MDVTIWDELIKRHPAFRHNFSAMKVKLFRMEVTYRKVRDILLGESGKGRPPKIPIFYEIYEGIMGDRANAQPPALAGSLPGANVGGSPPSTPNMADQAPPTEGVGIASTPQRVVSSPSPSPTPQPMSPPPAPAIVATRNASPELAEASPTRSRVVGAGTGLGLRGNRVVHRPGPAAAETDLTSTVGGAAAFGSQLTGSDASLCDEIATRVAGTVRGLMRENFEEFMELTRVLVQSPPDAPAAKKRRDTQSDEPGDGSA
ncbi:unnamed protein product [Closterium sp. Naga37s-1]|nr:unnamed protein product [Closterium sp. Naga37s-1]